MDEICTLDMYEVRHHSVCATAAESLQPRLMAFWVCTHHMDVFETNLVTKRAVDQDSDASQFTAVLFLLSVCPIHRCR